MRNVILVFVFASLLFGGVQSQNIGIHKTSPQQKLDVNGKIQIYTDDAPATAGAMRFDTASNSFQGFDGFQWVTFANTKSNEKPETDAFINPSDGVNWTFKPMCAINNNGQAAIVYTTYTPGVDRLYLSFYENGQWSHPNISEQINPPGSYLSSVPPKIAMNNNGDFIIVYAVLTDPVNLYQELYYAEYKGGTWITQGTSLKVSSNIVGQHDVAISDNGDIVICWTEKISGDYHAYKAEKRNGSWTYPVSQEDSFSGEIQNSNVSNVKVVLDKNGEGIIIWSMYHPAVSFHHLYMAEYKATKWTYPESVDHHFSMNAGLGNCFNDFQLDMNDNGEAIVSWAQEFSTKMRIFKAELANSIWTFPVNQDDFILYPQSVYMRLMLDMNNDGNVLILAICDHVDGTVGSAQLFRLEKKQGVWNIPPLNIPLYPINDDIFGGVNYAKAILSNNRKSAFLVSGFVASGSKHYIIDYMKGRWTDSDPDEYAFHGYPTTGSDIAINDEGKIIVVWSQQTESTNGVYELFTYFK